MKIEYPTSIFGAYTVVNYQVSVQCKDDGAHFPYFTYNGYLLLRRREDVDKTDEELYAMVIDHMKSEFSKHMHVTFDELLADPAFEDINVRVSKEIHYAEQIKITK